MLAGLYESIGARPVQVWFICFCSVSCKHLQIGVITHRLNFVLYVLTLDICTVFFICSFFERQHQIAEAKKMYNTFISIIRLSKKISEDIRMFVWDITLDDIIKM